MITGGNSLVDSAGSGPGMDKGSTHGSRRTIWEIGSEALEEPVEVGGGGDVSTVSCLIFRQLGIL